MVNENNINLIAKENYKKVEEVREIENKIPSFEEFVKGYEVDKKVSESYELEVDSYGDMSMNKSYGPGNNQSHLSMNDPFKSFERFDREQRDRRRNEEINRAALFVTETVAKATAATVLTTATGGLAPFIGGGAWIGGEWLKSNSDEFLQFLGRGMSDLGGGMFSGGLFASSTVGEFAKKSGIDLKKLENFFEIKGKAETVWAISEHNRHKNEGISYRSNCELCNL